LEDTARFVLDDAELTARSKALRHEITTILVAVQGDIGSPGRDVHGDVGTHEDLPSERFRPGIVSVAMAAGHRAGEALRSLEEYVKILDETLASALEQLRYQAYDLQTAIVDGLSRNAPRNWRVQVILTESICSRRWQDVLEAAIAGGADSIQVREKSFGAEALIKRIRAVIEVARPAGVAVIVNDHPDVALAAGADGVHLGNDDFPINEARRVIGGSMVLGGTAHSVEEASRNRAMGCDYCGVGRMFSSRTKPEVDHGGTDLLAACTRELGDWPLLAIGGIDASNLAGIIEAGGRAVAVCESVCAASAPDEVVAAMRLALESAETHLSESTSE
jgi:thiamine-phosphate pyrophosphorylase